jgi:hypothetical protein
MEKSPVEPFILCPLSGRFSCAAAKGIKVKAADKRPAKTVVFFMQNSYFIIGVRLAGMKQVFSFATHDKHMR